MEIIRDKRREGKGEGKEGEMKERKAGREGTSGENYRWREESMIQKRKGSREMMEEREKKDGKE